MTDIKQYLPYCVGRKATIDKLSESYKSQNTYVHFELGGKYWVIYELLHIVQIYDLKIIPHMRKLSSLTEDEARELARLSEIENFDSYSYEYTTYNEHSGSIIKEMQPAILCTVFGNLQGRSHKLIPLDKFSPAQFHYLTSIGIAWWATDEMWESGAIIEIND